MSDLLDILMKDPTVKEEMVLRARKSIKNLVFTKKDTMKIKTAMVDMIAEMCDLTSGDNDDNYYEIQDLITKAMKKIITNKFSNENEKE